MHGNIILHYPNPWDPSKVLPALQCLGFIRSVVFDLFHVISLDNVSAVNVTNNKNKSPEKFSGKCGIMCAEASFATWILPSLPKILIQHCFTWKGPPACHPYKDDRAGWKAFVAANLRVPVYPAFDLTANFHTRDLSTGKGGHRLRRRLIYGDIAAWEGMAVPLRISEL